MKQIHQYIFAAIFSFAVMQSAHAQTKNPVNRDSIMAKGMHQMQHDLLLTDAQVSAIVKLTKDYEAKLKNGGFEKKNLELRKKQLADHYDTYRKGLKQILTADQWKQYEAIDAKRREAVIQQMKAKKIMVVPGEIRN